MSEESREHDGNRGPEPTSGQNVPKSNGGKFREKSNVPLHSERLQQDADSSGFAARVEKKQARRVEKSAYRAEKTGAKLEKAVKKRNKQKPPKNPGPIKSARRAAQFELYRYAHKKINQVEHENVGIEAAHKTELAGEKAVRGTTRFVKRRIRTRPARMVKKWEKRDIKAKADHAYKKLVQENPALKKNAISRFVQKQRIKRKYQKQAREVAKKGAKAAKKTAVTTEKIAASVGRFIVRNPKVLLIIGIALVLIFVVQSCMGMVATIGGGIAGAGGAAENADAIYTRLETDLQIEIDGMETANPGYDEYRRVIGPIGHNPAELMGFLAVCDSFPELEMENVLREIFNEQYTLTTREISETQTETTTIQAGEPIGQVRTTAYCACAICCGPYANGITASGATATANRTIAVDAYNPIVPMGTTVIINGAAYTVEDTGDLNAHNADFDIYFNTHAEAMAWGRQTHTAYYSGDSDTEVTTTTTRRVLEITLTVKPFAEAVAVRLTPEQLERFNQYDYIQ